MSEKIGENPREILSKYIKEGPFKAREITKIETEKNSEELRDAARKNGEDIINNVLKKFLEYPPEKNYKPFSKGYMELYKLATELTKTFQNAFRLAEEGYYRSAFGELRDMLEMIMKIKLFYEDRSSFNKWLTDSNALFTTSDIRSTPIFKNSGLNEEIKKLSNALSNNRHCSHATLDARGPIVTNISYYRKDLFEKWCRHIIMLKDLSIKIIDFEV